ncbi:MAG: LuxR C-terminal-related transcriptional regulator, partial [Chloroflexota bacterium]
LERWADANERLARAMWISGGTEEGLERLEATAKALERTGHSPVRARVLAGIAGSHMLRGDHPQAIAAAKAAIDEARATGARLSEAHALNTLGTSTSLLGECGEGLRLLRDAFDLTRELNDVDDRGRSYANLSSTLLICGSGEESLRVSLDGMAWARGVGATNGYGRYLAGNAVDAAVRVGRWDVAAELAEDLMASDVIGVNRLGMITVLGVFYARRGDTGEAERLLEEGRATVAPLHEAQFTGQVYVGLVEIALTTGRADQAAAAAADGVDMISRTADRYYLMDVLTIAARAEADRAEVARAARDSSTATNAVEAARRYLETLESWLAETPGPSMYGGQLTAAVSLSAAEARRAEGIADPDAWRRAVDDIDRAGMAWPMAYARYRLGEALLTVRTPRREVAAVLGDAHIKAAGLGATPLVGWIEALARRSRIAIGPATTLEEPESAHGAADDDHGLTAREREVLALLVEGHTNRRIAEELFISESTAGVHVSNILGKLGVATRTEAATVAARLGLVD